jgi:hypothetical protein
VGYKGLEGGSVAVPRLNNNEVQVEALSWNGREVSEGGK